MQFDMRFDRMMVCLILIFQRGGMPLWQTFTIGPAVEDYGPV